MNGPEIIRHGDYIAVDFFNANGLTDLVKPFISSCYKETAAILLRNERPRTIKRFLTNLLLLCTFAILRATKYDNISGAYEHTTF